MMKFTSRPSILAACGLTLASVAPLRASVIQDYSLSGSQVSTFWNDLSNTTNAARTPMSGTGAVTVQAPGYQAGVGFYSYSTAYTSTVTQTSAFDISNVIFQADIANNPDFSLPFSGGPLLSFNGGSQNIAANYFANSGSEDRVTSFGNQTYTGTAWQWDLSAYGETINSISIVNPYSVHTSVAGLRVDAAGGAFVAAIPEPSSFALFGLAGGLLFIRRRR